MLNYRHFLVIILASLVSNRLEAQNQYQGCFPMAPGTDFFVEPKPMPEGNIPPACQGQPYETYFRFVVPTDTTFAGQVINVNYFEVIGDTGLTQNGITYECLDYSNGGQGVVVADCKFNGGQAGCVKVKSIGNVTANPGTYPVKLFVRANVQSATLPIPIPFNINAGFEGYELVIKPASQCTQSIDEALTTHKITFGKVYPNPAQDGITLHLNAPETSSAILSIVDVLGRTVQQETVNLTYGETIVTTSVAQLTKGIYYMVLKNTTDLNQNTATQVLVVE